MRYTGSRGWAAGVEAERFTELCKHEPAVSRRHHGTLGQDYMRCAVTRRRAEIYPAVFSFAEVDPGLDFIAPGSAQSPTKLRASHPRARGRRSSVWSVFDFADRVFKDESKAMSEQKSKFGRRYDREFKENAVALVLKGRSQGEVSRDLGVSPWSLGEWVKQAKEGQAQRQPKTLDAQSAEQREVRHLRQENQYLRQQRDILKKALGILSAEMPAHVSR